MIAVGWTFVIFWLTLATAVLAGSAVDRAMPENKSANLSVGAWFLSGWHRVLSGQGLTPGHLTGAGTFVLEWYLLDVIGFVLDHLV